MELRWERLAIRSIWLFILFRFGSAVYQCNPNEVTVFVRVPRARLTGSPTIVSNAGDDISCAYFCKNNIEPTTGAPRPCASFNYDGRQTCYFFDNAATPAGSAILSPNPSASNFYYEKVCVPAVSAHQACAYRSFAFERSRNSRLDGFVKKAVQVQSREECLAACLLEESFVCRSVNYNYNTFFCEMSDQDRRSKPQYIRNAFGEPTDYFDNNCLTRQNRCGQIGGNLIFVKTSNFEIHYFDHTQNFESQESYCLQRCLDSLNTFCRSVEYSATTKKCTISDEDTFSRADFQGAPHSDQKDYYEPVCVAADLSSSTCRQQAAFERTIGSAVQGQPIATAQGITVADCISLCFQNLNCKSFNYDRTKLTCYVYAIGKGQGAVSANPATDFYEFNCESQFGGMALCTNEGIRFIVNTKEPYTGAIYAADRFASCSKTVENSKQIIMTFPPPTVTTDCGTVLKDGKLEALVVVSLDGVLPHQVTTEWDRFYRVTCDTSLKGMGEGSVIVTTIYDVGEQATVLPAATPGPVTATLMFLDKANNMVSQATIGDEIFLVVKSDQAGPNNMMLMDCTASRVGGSGDSVPFRVIDNGCPRYPALVGPVVQDYALNRLAAHMKAFRLDGSYDIQMTCTVMFCAGAHGCPQSNCLDGSNNQLFQSYGRKKRSAKYLLDIEHNNNSTSSSNHETENYTGASGVIQEDSQERLSAIIRVLAEGEGDTLQKATEDVQENPSVGFLHRSQNLVQLETHISDEMMCIAEGSFISIIVTASLLCLIFSFIIVGWGCSKLRKGRRSTSSSKSISSIEDSTLRKHASLSRNAFVTTRIS